MMLFFQFCIAWKIFFFYVIAYDIIVFFLNLLVLSKLVGLSLYKRYYEEVK